MTKTVETSLCAAFLKAGGDPMKIALLNETYTLLRNNGGKIKVAASILSDRYWADTQVRRFLFDHFVEACAADMRGDILTQKVPAQAGGEVQVQGESRRPAGLANPITDSARSPGARGEVHAAIESQVSNGLANPIGDGSPPPDASGEVQKPAECQRLFGLSAASPARRRKAGVPRGADAIASVNELRFYQTRMTDRRLFPYLYMSELAAVAITEDFNGRRNAFLCRKALNHVANPSPGSRVRDYVKASIFQQWLDEFEALNVREPAHV